MSPGLDGEWDQQGGGGVEVSVDEEVERLRSALRETKRRLLAEVTAAKMVVAEREEQVEEVGTQMVALQESNDELTALVTRLEEDIVKVRQARKEGYLWKDLMKRNRKEDINCRQLPLFLHLITSDVLLILIVLS